MTPPPKFFDLVSELDRIIATGPTERNVGRFTELVSQPALHTYAFGHISGPEWLRPLYEAGFFRVPPEVQIDAASGGIAHPYWPESAFLARVAPAESELVAEIVLGIPETANQRVHHDIVEVAVALPVRLQAELGRREAAWVTQQKHLWFGLPDKIGELVAHLAVNSEISTALELCHAILEVRPSDRGGDSEAAMWRPLEPRIRCDFWDYERIVRKHVPRLVTAAGERALALLSDLLASAIEFSRRSSDEGDEDFSQVWRKRLETEPEHHLHGPKDVLTTAVRDAVGTLIRSGLADLHEMVDFLEARRFKVFRRIALFTLAEAENADLKQVTERLLDQRLSDDLSFRHEYSLLARSHFGRLRADDQQKLLSYIDSGPDRALVRQWYQWAFDAEPSEGDILRQKAIWQRDHLVLFGSTLPPEWQQRLRELVLAIGPANEPIVQTTTVGIGSQVDDVTRRLQDGSIDSIIEAICAAEAAGTAFGQWGSAFASVLTGLGRDPDRWHTEFRRFEQIDVRHAPALVEGFRQAMRGEQRLPWAEALSYLEWVTTSILDLYNDPASRSTAGDLTLSVAQFLSDAFDSDGQALPLAHRREVWKVLANLAQVLHDDSLDPMRLNEDNEDIDFHAINSGGGKVLDTVIRYALWVRRSFEASQQPLPTLTDDLSEVRDVLDTTTDVNRSSSLAVRSVLGRWYPWLVLLDATWAAAHVDRIFRLPIERPQFGLTAWHSYVTQCQAYDSVFTILSSVYRDAVGRIGQVHQSESKSDPDNRLGEHLIVLYWRGQIPLWGSESLIQQYVTHGNVNHRAHVIKHAGRSLANSKHVPHPFIDRLREFWEERRKAVVSASQADAADELTGFGWWFVSGHFPKDWSLSELIQVLRLGKKIEVEHMVAEQLAQDVQRRPVEAVEALKLMILAERDWSFIWPEETRGILRSALTSTSATAKVAAEDLVHALGQKGHFEYRDLLSLTNTG